MRSHAIAALCAALLAIAGTLLIVHWMSPDPVVESYKPAAQQADGSLLVERKPDSAARPRSQIPKGTAPARNIEVVAQSGAPDCPPVTVDLALVREHDGGQRVVASSPDGRILRAVDVPIDTAAPPDIQRWAAGISYDPLNRTGGAWLDRDIGRVRLGAELNQVRTDTQRIVVEARVRVGVTF